MNSVVEFLKKLEISVGQWNQLISLASENNMSIDLCLGDGALENYATSSRLGRWIGYKGGVLFQVDNSTAPMPDEEMVFCNILSNFLLDFNLLKSKSYLMNVRGGKDECGVNLLIYFSLIFKWHVHFLSGESRDGARLSIQDGVVYFMGAEAVIAGAGVLIDKIKRNSLEMG